MPDTKLISHIVKTNRLRNQNSEHKKEFVIILKNKHPYTPGTVAINLKEKLKDLGITEFGHYNAAMTYPGIGSILEVITFAKEEDGHLAYLSMQNIIHGERL